MYGLPWLEEAWKYIREDAAQNYRWLMLTAPLGKTPMDKRGGQVMRSYAQKLDRALEAMTPWTQDSKFTTLRRKYGKSMGDTQIIVTFDPQDDPESSLFKGAMTEHELQKRARDKRRKVED